MPVLFLLSGPKMGLRPAGTTHFPDKREIWHGERSGGLLHRAKFHVY